MHRRTRGVGFETAGEQPTRAACDEGRAEAGRARQEEPTPVHAHRCRAFRRPSRRCSVEGSQDPPEHPGSSGCAQHRGKHVLRRSLGPGRGGDDSDEAEGCRSDVSPHGPTNGGHADQRRDDREDHADPREQRRLVVEPKVRIAKLFSHSGVASIAALPTATIGEAPGSMSPATSCATPIATAPQSSPTTTPAPTRRSATGADVEVEGGATVRAIGQACAKDVARPLRCARCLRHRSDDRLCRPDGREGAGIATFVP